MINHSWNYFFQSCWRSFLFREGCDIWFYLIDRRLLLLQRFNRAMLPICNECIYASQDRHDKKLLTNISILHFAGWTWLKLISSHIWTLWPITTRFICWTKHVVQVMLVNRCQYLQCIKSNTLCVYVTEWQLKAGIDRLGVDHICKIIFSRNTYFIFC